jgi:hypothetical protein
MSGGWITGKEACERFNLQVVEIAEACFYDRIQAHEAVTLWGFVEETSVAKIPCFLPEGEKAKDFTRYGVRVFWCWPEAPECDSELYRLYLPEDESVFFPERHQIHLFPFRFEDFSMQERFENTEYSKIVEAYRAEIEAMVFRLAEMEKLFSKQNISILDAKFETKCEAEQEIECWQNILQNLKGAELIAARIAIEKWRGATHKEAFCAVRPDARMDNAANFIARKACVARTVAERYGLKMPVWDTRDVT